MVHFCLKYKHDARLPVYPISEAYTLHTYASNEKQTMIIVHLLLQLGLTMAI